jgi:hypothetical protein
VRSCISCNGSGSVSIGVNGSSWHPNAGWSICAAQYFATGAAGVTATTNPSGGSLPPGVSIYRLTVTARRTTGPMPAGDSCLSPYEVTYDSASDSAPVWGPGASGKLLLMSATPPITDLSWQSAFGTYLCDGTGVDSNGSPFSGQNDFATGDHIPTSGVTVARFRLTAMNEPAAGTMPVVDHSMPSAPSDLRVQSSSSKVVLDWGVHDSDIDHFNVWRKSSGGDWSTSPVATVKEATFTDASVTNGVAYAYRVTAVDRAGNQSPPSAETWARPLAVVTTPVNYSNGDCSHPDYKIRYDFKHRRWAGATSHFSLYNGISRAAPFLPSWTRGSGVRICKAFGTDSKGKWSNYTPSGGYFEAKRSRKATQSLIVTAVRVGGSRGSSCKNPYAGVFGGGGTGGDRRYVRLRSQKTEGLPGYNSYRWSWEVRKPNLKICEVVQFNPRAKHPLWVRKGGKKGSIVIDYPRSPAAMVTYVTAARR